MCEILQKTTDEFVEMWLAFGGEQGDFNPTLESLETLLQREQKDVPEESNVPDAQNAHAENFEYPLLYSWKIF